MAISYKEVPTNARANLIVMEFDNSGSMPNAPSILPQKIAVIGQYDGRMDVQPFEPVRIFDPNEAAIKWGYGSMLHLMAIKLLPSNVEVWFFPVPDDETAAKATGSILIGGSPSVSAELSIRIIGKKIKIGFLKGNTPAIIAQKLCSEINNMLHLPVTSDIDETTPEQINLTAKWAGATGIDISIITNYMSDEVIPEGLTITITDMIGGAVDPNITSVLDLFKDEHYTIVLNPYTSIDTLNLLKERAAFRFTAMQAKGFCTISAMKGDYNTITTFTKTFNSQFLSIFDASNSPEMALEWAADITRVAAKSFQNNPAVQLNSLPTTLLPSKGEDIREYIVRNAMQHDGCSTHYVKNGKVHIDGMITTYRENELGAADVSYLYVNTLMTLMAVRYDQLQKTALKYRQKQIANDGDPIPEGVIVLTPNRLKADLLNWYIGYVESLWCSNLEQYKKNLIVERNQQNPNRVDVSQSIYIASNARVIAIKTIFSVFSK